MSHPTIRVLAMLELLQARRQLSGAELAAGLGVDQRTVRRYALRLADLGILVTAERGRYGGYRLLPGHRLPPRMLTDDEAAAVVIGLLAAERLGQPVAGISTALAKIQRVLPAMLSERVAALRQTLDLTEYQRKPAVAADTGTAVPYAHEIEVVLATTLANAQRRIPPTVATLAETEGGAASPAAPSTCPGSRLCWPGSAGRSPSAVPPPSVTSSARCRTACVPGARPSRRTEARDVVPNPLEVLLVVAARTRRVADDPGIQPPADGDLDTEPDVARAAVVRMPGQLPCSA